MPPITPFKSADFTNLFSPSVPSLTPAIPSNEPVPKLLPGSASSSNLRIYLGLGLLAVGLIALGVIVINHQSEVSERLSKLSIELKANQSPLALKPITDAAIEQPKPTAESVEPAG